ncbi:MAG: undecaprenyldiphospho-muramoylpentapeptide beta-N-acetylglucosaminyltransferase [Firmicutes bacterium ZCTH02-B6]|nr:MAG: undecaprenyldiphospho-muramoylpentapeptide beta-N-acetylglucosaminyltransferase [Firmicutes bacterium ZCTH02-B6]
MRVLIAAGGTGGHIYPGITIAQTIRARHPDASILFVGTNRGLEADIVPRAGFPFAGIPARYLRRRLSLDVLRTGWTAVRGVVEAVRIVRRFRPHVAVGTGGYVSGPAMAAALLLRVPVVLQEQNAYPGLTNRMLGGLAAYVALGHPEAKGHLTGRARVVVTGNPIRDDVLTSTRTAGLAAFGLEPGHKTLLVFGGSQGGRSINQAVLEAAPRLLQLGIQILHQTGKAGYASVVAEAERRMAEACPGTAVVRRNDEHVILGRWHVLPYIHDMPAAYAVADLVVSRAGAITLAEITARGLPAILIPYPYAAEGHQDANARAMADAGAAVVVPDKDLNGDVLVEQVRALLQNPGRLVQMGSASRALARPDAAERIADLIEKAARR